MRRGSCAYFGGGGARSWSATGLPDLVFTGWATWLRAALYYSEYFPAVCTIVNNSIGGGPSVSRAKEAVNVDNLVPDLVRINRYRIIAANVEFLEEVTTP